MRGIFLNIRRIEGELSELSCLRSTVMFPESALKGS